MPIDDPKTTGGAWQPEIVERAWAFATRQHAGQTFGGPGEGERVEYLNHIGSVVMEVMWALGFETTADGNLAVSCAILHDTIEDTGAQYETLVQEFGRAVADGVLALSKDSRLPTKAAQMEDSLARIRYQPKEVWMVKLADRISNLDTPPFYWTNEKIRAYLDEARLIHEALGCASAVLARRLEEKMAAYPRYLRPEPQP